MAKKLQVLNNLVGKSAYEVALDDGFEGTEAEWLESLKGETGPKGDKGDTGETGPSGKDGKSGVHFGPEEPTDPDVNVWVDLDGDPDPLPVASADTLGCVKVGEGLQMKEGVLGVKPEDNYELIDTIVLDEEVNVIRINVEPDGTPYRLRGLYINVITPCAEQTSLMYLSVIDNYGKSTAMALMNGSINAYELGGIGQAKVEIKNGFLDGYGVGAKNAETSAMLYRYVNTNTVPRKVDTINAFALQAIVNIPVGTTITVWGVRA